tara:strand:- start:54 stop:722 length:669 start_codon:yes stop_codon:yes gene_type:complete
MPTRNSLVKINYNDQDCLAQFSWPDLPDLVDDDGRKEKWKLITAADHKMLDVSMSKIFEYFVSDMSRFKSVVKSTQNATITNYRGKKRPSITLKKKHTFSRVVALVFHPEQLKAKIAELKIAKQKDKDGNDYTFATLQVDHIAENDPTNHNANNLQFMMPQKNSEKSNGHSCRIWEIGSDTKTDYPSVVAAADAMGYTGSSSVHDILKNNKHKKWRGEYIVK